MEKKFWEYYHPTKEELLEMKKDSIFIFDSCTLLNLYSFNRDKRKRVLSLLKEKSKEGRVWIPHQFMSEFHKNRINRIDQEFNRKEKYIEGLEKLKSNLSGQFPLADRNHYSFNIDRTITAISTFLEKHINFLKSKENNPDWREFHNDTLLKSLNSILKNRVGLQYSDDELVSIQSVISKRIELKKQPGISDISKNSSGDTMAWLQILDHFSIFKKSIILITAETKDDFWETKKAGDRTFPKRSLIREFYDKTGQLFFVMNLAEWERFCIDKKYVPVFETSNDLDVGIEVFSNDLVVVGADNSKNLEEKLTND